MTRFIRLQNGELINMAYVVSIKPMTEHGAVPYYAITYLMGTDSARMGRASTMAPLAINERGETCSGSDNGVTLGDVVLAIDRATP